MLSCLGAELVEHLYCKQYITGSWGKMFRLELPCLDQSKKGSGVWVRAFELRVPSFFLWQDYQ